MFIENNHSTERYIKAEKLSTIHKVGLLYGFIEIYENNSKVYVSTLEVLPDYWFIFLQIIEEFFQEGVGSWEFPTLIKFEAMDSTTIRIQQNEELYYFHNRTLIKALLDACIVFVCASENFMNYPYPFEKVKEKYLKIIQELHLKNSTI
ncbi:hypothetical protein ACIQXI_06365 [Lysinibacillus sp. NPDC097195]|uniref:hypothetical protein n=1 Tax=Lysinibacillus sp. NPDC097195 TaxID=3364141 RepID=UPI003830D0C7